MPKYPPKIKASPWISTKEKLESIVGNGGPNVSKRKVNVKEMSIYVVEFDLFQTIVKPFILPRNLECNEFVSV